MAGPIYKQWMRICCFLAIALSLVASGHPFILENVDGCQRSCPCDAPAFHEELASLSDCESEEDCACGVNCECEAPDLVPSTSFQGDSVTEQSEPPCPRDCSDCGCQANQVMVGLLIGSYRLQPKPGGQWYVAAHPFLVSGTASGIFHPPRTQNS